MDVSDEESEISEERKVLRYASLYSEDGDLVIAAEKKDENTVHMFRVNTAILKYHSRVFSDMLEMPAGPAGVELYDGVPVVRLPDESADVVRFLRVLYYPGCVHIVVWSYRAYRHPELHYSAWTNTTSLARPPYG